MCYTPDSSKYATAETPEVRSAEQKISDMLSRDTGCVVPPKLMRLFIVANWSRLSVLAHKIHDEAND